MSDQLDRRIFLQGGAVTLGYFFTAPAFSAVRAADSPNEKVHFAGIGVGGKGSSDVDNVGGLGEVVALCDIDENSLNAKANHKIKSKQKDEDGREPFAKAQKFFDFRQMFDKIGKQIDAVTVSTADHAHAQASIMAMRLKKHVYCQKPLTHTVYEARLMRETAKKYGVCTQMGNQGTTENGLRRAVEMVQEGVLGKVTEVHVWTNRPIWPQGAEAILAVPNVRETALAVLHNRPLPTLKYPAAPSHVHWDLFLAGAPERPYTPGIHPFAWRGWWDYGTGALGDMACHTANMAFMALKLGHPTSVRGDDKAIEGLNPETYPTQAHVEWVFPARGDMPEVKFHWYEGQRGGKKMLPPEKLLAKLLKPGEKLSDSGSILVGDKGVLFSPNDYGAAFRLVPEEAFKEVQKSKPEKLPVNGGGDFGQKKEWVQAIREGKPELALSNFDYAGMLTEAILLGNVAIRFPGKKLEWDGPALKITNAPEANQLINPGYRKGWDLSPTI